VRSYAGVEEVLLVALGELLDGRDARFDTAGEADIENEELARTACASFGREELPVVRHRDPDAAPDLYVSQGDRFRALAARHGIALRDLPALVAATATGPPASSG